MLNVRNTPLELSMFREVRQVTVHITTTALQLDTVMYKHVVVLLHVSAFFVHLQGGTRFYFTPSSLSISNLRSCADNAQSG
jgi:hypothetical protein